MFRTFLVWLGVVLSAVTIGAASNAGQASSPSNNDLQLLRFDIAEDHTRSVFGEKSLHDDGTSAYSSMFISQGYIYPAGTLSGGNGVLASGEPEFPDLVIGEWTCRGWHIGNTGNSTVGFWAVTTQLYRLNEEYDSATILTDGYESREVGVRVDRTIIGGTGRFTGVEGEQGQIFLGFTEYGGVNFRVLIGVVFERRWNSWLLPQWEGS